MSSGIKPGDDVLTAFTELKSSKLYSYVIFKFSDDYKSLYVADKGPTSTSHEQFIKLFTKNEVFFALYDLPHTTKSGVESSKLILISWNGLEAPTKMKMMLASSFQDLKNKIDPGITAIQASSIEEIEYEELCRRIIK